METGEVREHPSSECVDQQGTTYCIRSEEIVLDDGVVAGIADDTLLVRAYSDIPELPENNEYDEHEDRLPRELQLDITAREGAITRSWNRHEYGARHRRRLHGH